MDIKYPIIEQINDEEYALVAEYTTQLPNGDYLLVFPDFIYDGASIPRCLWSIIGSPFTGTHSRAAFIHDVLYAAELYDRSTCDWLFLELMQACGTSWWKRNAMWSAVRSGGGIVWANHDKKEVEFNRKIAFINYGA